MFMLIKKTVLKQILTTEHIHTLLLNVLDYTVGFAKISVKKAYLGTFLYVLSSVKNSEYCSVTRTVNHSPPNVE